MNGIDIPRGSILAWQSASTGQWDLDYALPESGVAMPLVRTPGLSETRPNVRPGSTSVVYAAYRENDESDLYVVSPDTPDPVRLTNAPGIDTYPVWSVDGAYVYFVSDRDGNADIFRVRADGTETIKITASPYPEVYLVMRSDGSELGWVRITGPTSGEIVVYDLTTHNATVLDGPIPYVSSLTWQDKPGAGLPGVRSNWIFTCEGSGDIWFDLCRNREHSYQSFLYATSPAQSDLFASSSIAGIPDLLVTENRYVADGESYALADVSVLRLKTSSDGNYPVSMTPFLDGDPLHANATSGRTELNPPFTTLGHVPRYVSVEEVDDQYALEYMSHDAGTGSTTGWFREKPESGAWKRLYGSQSSPMILRPFLEMGVGDSRAFSITGSDLVGNLEYPNDRNSFEVTLYFSKVQTQAIDNRTVPLPAATVDGSNILTTTGRTLDGHAVTYMLAESPFTLKSEGYLSGLPTSSYYYMYSIHDMPYALLNSPAINANPSFESGLEGYTATNTVVLSEPTLVISGDSFARLNWEGTLAFEVTIPSTLNNPTFSFAYATSDAMDDQFEVQITDPVTTTTYTYDNQAQQFRYFHEWIDL